MSDPESSVFLETQSLAEWFTAVGRELGSNTEKRCRQLLSHCSEEKLVRDYFDPRVFLHKLHS